jgi:hypothetical protein
LQAFFELLAAHRNVFGQERVYRRVVGLVLGEVFGFARHTVTQGLLALGLTDADWSPWYRLFSRPRFDPNRASKCLFRETLQHVDPAEAYVIGVDGVQVPRSSLKMPGTSWLKASRTAGFKPGLHRAQRFVNLSWLVPMEDGYSRAIPLRWLSAYTAKAVPADEAPHKEWEAGLMAIRWVRTQLDEAGRQAQWLLVLVDGSYERVVAFWRGLPERTVCIGRSARNRALCELPTYTGFGRPPEYGPLAQHPSEWLHEKRGWKTTQVRVRGKPREMRYRLEGPFVRNGMPRQPVFLGVVRGLDRQVNGHRIRRKPAFFLVNASQEQGQWVLPLPIESLLAWAWQRWELEVQHRELKSGFGLGEKQCWNVRSATVSVQWSAWVYALLLLAGYRTFGLLHGPPTPGRWWPGARRWSFNTLWRAFRAALWNTPDFRAVWTGSSDNWLKKDDSLAALWNSALAAARS